MNPFDYLKIQTALIKLDSKQRRKAGYNPYAMSHYMGALGNIKDMVKSGSTLRAACCACLCGRLLDVVLKSLGEPISTNAEQRGIR